MKTERLIESGLYRNVEAQAGDRFWENGSLGVGRGTGVEKLLGRERRAGMGKLPNRAGVSWLQLWQAMRSKR